MALKDRIALKVEEMYVARHFEEANQKLKEGWVLLDCIVALRRVHHLPDGEHDTAYEFDVPFFSAVLVKLRKLSEVR